MKCPKCGYNSFEFHDACKKCSHDLTSYKATFGLKPIVIPQAARVVMAASVVETAINQQHQTTETEHADDMFSFDLPDEIADEGVAATPQSDPFGFTDTDETSGFGEFSFDDEPLPEQTAASASPVDDTFADLLKTTSQDDDPFALQDTPPAAPAQSPVTPGEFDLDSFSWDEPATDAQKPEDDFNNLFGNEDDKK